MLVTGLFPIAMRVEGVNCHFVYNSNNKRHIANLGALFLAPV